MEEPREHLDVVADFAYDSDNEAYNQAYRQWRRTNKAPYMYHYRRNRKEVTYVQGNALSMPDAPQTERKALLHCSERIGLVLIAGMMIEIIGATLIVWLLRLCGMNIRLDLLSFSMRGSSWTVTVVRILINCLKFGIPALLLIRMGHLPRGVVTPHRFGNLPAAIAACGAGMAIAGIYTLTGQDAGIQLAQEIFSGADPRATLLYGLTSAVVISLLAELFLRGAMLPMLRQFGDSFAVAMTAVAAFLFPNTLSDRIAELLIGLVSGYLMLRSGSLVKCILVRSVFTVLCYARLILVYTTETLPVWQYALLLVSIGSLSVAFCLRLRRKQFHLRNRETQLSELHKVSAISQSVTVLSWGGVTVLLMILQVFF